MKRTLMTFMLATLSMAAMAQATPAGLWRSFDEKTSEPTAEIRITDTGGVLNGKIEKRLLPNVKPDELCTQCSDDRKDKPKLGLEIIRGAKKAADAEVWEGGKLLDPSSGRSWTLKMTPIEGGKKMEVRGSFGPFGRTQTWTRIQ